MRELKFRVWTGNKMEYNVMTGFLGAFYVQGINPHDSACLSSFNTIYPKETPVMQFTGLLDANSKEIFEGDIVKTDQKHISFLMAGVPDYTKGEVRWLCESWKVCESKIGATHLGDFATCHCCNCGLEIIGNIFENPELLDYHEQRI